jgi:hypothetical protein
VIFLVKGATGLVREDMFVAEILCTVYFALLTLLQMEVG